MQEPLCRTLRNRYDRATFTVCLWRLRDAECLTADRDPIPDDRSWYEISRADLNLAHLLSHSDITDGIEQHRSTVINCAQRLRDPSRRWRVCQRLA
jgi:hypothetical protein